MLETDVGNLSKENFLRMEKITECEALLANYQVYKSKHDVVSTEKQELEDLLRVQVFDKKNTMSIKEEVEVLRSEICELTRSKEMFRIREMICGVVIDLTWWCKHQEGLLHKSHKSHNLLPQVVVIENLLPRPAIQKR
ncbi:EEIG1/EHBP1 N-terminal domain-containing protein [Artemisia annua]|uniref:EEIG1/EHBP1 N-terminal domain-containing protein n=1 Tax=Artemisia annua TaxID=35608 RepID=A0A2U1KJY9_ARTAN|nr:EEIG1/EHBP1 N-terminal domain-containing protein [Artemisia annua]